MTDSDNTDVSDNTLSFQSIVRILSPSVGV